ncbi:MAG: SpoIIE family protein phosphatase [Leptospirales bacterium]|nr:SpoIIE family protein phosphatase [Leptospirales bacterium]
MNRLFRIQGKILVLALIVGALSAGMVAAAALTRSRSVLVDKTLEVCRNLSVNISRAAREELLLDTIYDNTRAAVSGLSDRDGRIEGLAASFVINREGLIVAHTDPARLGGRVSAGELQNWRGLESLTQSEVRADGKAYLRFAQPIRIPFENRSYWVGAAIFDFDRDTIYAPVFRIQRDIILLAALALILAAAISYALARRLSRPIVDLAGAADRIGRGDFSVRLKATGRDEIATLTEVFNSMSVRLKASEAQRAQQAAMKREFEIARGIQMGLLPANGDYGPYYFQGLMRTADEVGGDYFDCIPHGAGRDRGWWFIIGDVSGHGLSAGLTMLMAQTALHAALLHDAKLDPARAYEVVNRTLYRNLNLLQQNRYMTAAFYRADSAGRFRGAGLHLDALIWRKRSHKVESAQTDGLWLGVEPDLRGILRPLRFQLQSGDAVLLYTDGLVEAASPSGELFGDERLIAAVAEFGDLPEEQFCKRLNSALEKFTGGAALADDVSFAFVRRRK